MFSSNTTQVSDGGYQISRSLRFNSADTTNLNRTFASAGNRKTFTLSFWLKRSRVGVNYEGFFASGNGTDQIRFENIDQLRFSLNSTASGDFVTTQVFRDVSAWYHIVFAVDTTQATSTNRVKIYVNGSQITSFTTASYPTLNYDCNFNSNVSHRLGIANDTSYPFNGYMTETYLIDGQALTPSSFGETNAQTGVWQPKAYSGSYGTNGFYLNFSDNSNTTAATLGKDYSGNGNNWTPNNFSVTAGAGNDSLVDSPTSYGTDTGVGGTVRGNYATLNPIIPATVTVTNGNLDISSTADNNLYATLETGTTGKWYAEFTITSATNSSWPFMGTRKADSLLGGNTSTFYPGVGTGGEVAYLASGNKYIAGNVSAYGTAYTQNDVIGIAIDCDNGATYFSKNGVFQNSGVPTSGASRTGAANTWTGASQSFFIGAAVGSASLALTSGTFNFGQRPFAYTAPSGYKALCTQNLPTPTIGATTATQAGKYFNAVTYTGTGSSLGVTGVGFQPDWVWVKSRSAATDHGLYDAVRGVQKQLESNTTTAETTETTGITAFGSDGFTTGALAQLNTSSATYVAWNWKANGSGSTNTAGSITSTVSANTTSGFSIITWTGNATQGATIGHGLGAVPALFIIKNRSTAGTNWPVKTNQLSTNSYLYLNAANGAASFSFFWPNDPTSSIIYLGSDADVNGNGNSMVCYAFAPVAGYSAFGSFTGNGSADGPFIYTGFRPAFVLIKRCDTTSGGFWNILDDTRNTSNVVNKELYANASNAEGTFSSVDFTSNGVKIRNSDSQYNGSSALYLYACFAENPFKYSLAR